MTAAEPAVGDIAGIRLAAANGGVRWRSTILRLSHAPRSPTPLATARPTATRD